MYITHKEVENRLKKIVEELSGIKPETGTRFLEDLQFDSLSAVELLMRVEDSFLLSIGQNEEEEADKLKTFGEVVNLVERLLKEQPAAR
jgi:acyl carrier protein